jgi:hypothetical protein
MHQNFRLFDTISRTVFICRMHPLPKEYAYSSKKGCILFRKSMHPFPNSHVPSRIPA